MRSEQRRLAREQEVIRMEKPDLDSSSTDDPARLRPVIDDAMHELDDADREAVLLRYFEGQDFRSVGTSLGISDDAARKRVLRAVERLRRILEQRGISSSESALTAALSGTIALAIPADLHACIIRSALAASLLSTPKVAPTLLQMTPMKATLLITGIVAGLATSTFIQRDSSARLRSENKSLVKEIEALHAAGDQLSARQSAADELLAGLRKEHSELLRLRDEVTRLRIAQRDQAKTEPGNPEGEDSLLRNQQVTIEAKFTELRASTLKKLAVESLGIDIGGVGVTAILTDEQLRALLHAFEQQSGADLLALPRVITLHNRAASISISQPDDPDSGGGKLGPSVDLLPVLSADRMTINLQATARLDEMVPASDASGAERKEARQTAVSGNAVMYDGQSAVLCQRLGCSDTGGKTSVEDPTYLVVLVTPTLVDPAGNRLHPVEQITTDVSAGATHPISTRPNGPVEPVQAFRASPEQ
jgi:hypothetical protein